MKLRFLRRNLKIRNMKTKESAYKPLVHPTLEYPGLILLGTHILQITSTQQRKYYIKPQDGLQTDPIKPVSTPSLDWPTLQHKKPDFRCSTNFTDRTRHRKNNTCSYDISSCRIQYKHMSFFPRIIPEWNSLPLEVVMTKSMDCFKAMLAVYT